MRTLLLDAGGAEENDNHLVPAFHADASEHPVPARREVGGCTAHHALITMYPYNRDWDAIAAETGDPSWQSAAMRRYFERLERCTYRPRPKELSESPVPAALLRRVPFVAARYRNDARHGFDGRLPTALADPSQVPGFWLGLAMMHDLFTREHNAICDHLHAACPAWDDEELFQRARLVNAALLAKIRGAARQLVGRRGRTRP
ncbi:peroxidase family protein [Streptomyces sp. NPDC001406]|uniref:peroxidase family protein n=1 Tax=Streptomyces sp. NPDC001406 TaxID=3364572 RepID=UPI0036CC52BE